MATKSKTVTKTTSFSWSRIFRIIAFWAVVFIACALILSKIIPSIGSALQLIGNILAYIVVLAYSFSYALYKRNIWYFVAWAVACVLIVVFVILAA